MPDPMSTAELEAVRLRAEAAEPYQADVLMKAAGIYRLLDTVDAERARAEKAEAALSELRRGLVDAERKGDE